MKYFIKEFQIEEGVKFTAGTKARDDFESILTSEGFEAINIEINAEKRKNSKKEKILSHKKVVDEWEKKLINLSTDDVLLIQFPVIHHSLLLWKLIKKMKKKGVSVVLLVHDLDMFRVALEKDNSIKKRIRISIEEKSLLHLCDRVIVHNEKMKNKLVNIGFDEKKLVCLEIFDYLIPDFEQKYSGKSFSLKEPIIIAGALRKHKAKYVYDLPSDVKFNLYGVGYEQGQHDNIHYFGVFPPDDLPFKMKGSFGLIWDGETSMTCSGVYGEYLKINNPHKTSLYLASGLPVVVWKEAAIADFIRKYNCGILIESLDDINGELKNLSENDYFKLLENTQNVGKKIREGYFTKKCLKL